MNWNEKEILCTGGTGTLGKALTKLLMEKYHPRGIRIFSRDEFKQYHMKKEFPNQNISYLIGDIRDKERLSLACKGVHIIIHCAALKHLSTGESNPSEVILTNVLGSQNVLNAALENHVEKIIGISTDKACSPTNLYGSTKHLMEKLFIHGNIYSAGRNPRFSITRYGNVIGSRGSVIPLFKEQAKKGKFTVTDPDATRFWIKIEDVAQFILDRIEDMEGEEIFIPMMKSCSIGDLAKAINPDAEIVVTGLTQGEKLHETLITYDEGKRTLSEAGYFCIQKDILLPEWEYSSNNKNDKLTIEQIQKMIEGI